MSVIKPAQDAGRVIALFGSKVNFPGLKRESIITVLARCAI
jgi:hypothetical protein